jgi:hypothetical protein
LLCAQHKIRSGALFWFQNSLQNLDANST